MDVKEAVQAARSYIADVFGSEKISNMGLEEVEFDDSEGALEGHDRFQPSLGTAGRLGHVNLGLKNRQVRSYKVVHIGSDGLHAKLFGPVRQGSCSTRRCELMPPRGYFVDSNLLVLFTVTLTACARGSPGPLLLILTSLAANLQLRTGQLRVLAPPASGAGRPGLPRA